MIGALDARIRRTNIILIIIRLLSDHNDDDDAGVDWGRGTNEMVCTRFCILQTHVT